MILIRQPQTRDDFKAYYHLRYQVLREPWGQPKGSEKDDYEPISRHYMAEDDRTGELVGVVKWLERAPAQAWLTHLAVLPAFQKQGIGQLLAQTVEEAARAQAYTSIGANVRLNVTGYFEKLGYRITGIPTHYFATVQAVWMEKRL
jgi:ribosomal protein S18 acetylase RimI-like enzyme